MQKISIVHFTFQVTSAFLKSTNCVGLLSLFFITNPFPVGKLNFLSVLKGDLASILLEGLFLGLKGGGAAGR